MFSFDHVTTKCKSNFISVDIEMCGTTTIDKIFRFPDRQHVYATNGLDYRILR